MSTTLPVLSPEVADCLLAVHVLLLFSGNLLLSFQFCSEDYHSTLAAHFARISRLLFRRPDRYKYQKDQTLRSSSLSPFHSPLQAQKTFACVARCASSSKTCATMIDIILIVDVFSPSKVFPTVMQLVANKLPHRD